MSSNDAQFLSQWRAGNSNPAETISSRAKSFFSSAADAIQDGAEQAYNVLPLNSSDVPAEEPSWFQMSRFERIVAFVVFILGSALCFVLGIVLFPALTLKPRKFAMLWTMGSLLFVLSFGCLQGPMEYLRHVTSKDRLPFTAVFFGSVLGTLYCSAILKSTILTLIMGVVEIVAVVYYTVSYFPFGRQGLNMLSSFGASQVTGMMGL